ncbi:hypothetical protein V1264_008265 [Littorina saxatilis]|uniref:Uncharacterized protein n=1 Tax=Littorina saxatilis TaxID=31220 RepID=A0AAN9AT70_9CAEN
METKRSQFRIRFEEHLGNGGYTNFCLPDQETYQTIINLLSGTVSEKHRSLYYLRKKFEILEVGGLQKVIKLSNNPDDGIQYLLPKSDMFDALWDAHLSTGHGGEKKMRFFIADMYDN